MELTVCSQADFEAVAQLYREVVRHLESHINYPKWSITHPSRQYIRDSIAHERQYLCTVDGTAAGAFVLSADPEGDYAAGDWSVPLHEGEFLVVHALAVSPEFSRRGIGTFMVEQILQIARRQGFRAVRLDVVPDNVPAARLYESAGFTYAGTKDLRRNIREIPLFDLYEFNFS